MIPRQFEYHAPQSVPEAIALLQKYGDGAKLLAYPCVDVGLEMLKRKHVD